MPIVTILSIMLQVQNVFFLVKSVFLGISIIVILNSTEY